MTTAKPFTIPKRLVYEAFEAVKANAGSAGVDNETIEDFETNLKDNLYRIWNRMSSGSYVPPPVKAAAIPKKTGGERISASRQSRSAWRRWLSSKCLSRTSNLCSCQTRMATGRGNPRWTSSQ